VCAGRCYDLSVFTNCDLSNLPVLFLSNEKNRLFIYFTLTTSIDLLMALWMHFSMSFIDPMDIHNSSVFARFAVSTECTRLNSAMVDSIQLESWISFEFYLFAGLASIILIIIDLQSKLIGHNSLWFKYKNLFIANLTLNSPNDSFVMGGYPVSIIYNNAPSEYMSVFCPKMPLEYNSPGN